MRIHRGYWSLPQAALHGVVAIGNFDGVHRGHRALIEAAGDARPGARRAARRDHLRAASARGPDARPGAAPADAVPRQGAPARPISASSTCSCSPSTQHLMQKSPEAVRRTTCWPAASASATSWSATTSASATGARATSTRLRRARRASTASASPGSSRSPGAARSARRAGSARRSPPATSALARDLLGHPFLVEGRVVAGDRRGRELGYPTANLRPRPARPVAGRRHLRGARRLARQPRRDLARCGREPRLCARPSAAATCGSRSTCSTTRSISTAGGCAARFVERLRDEETLRDASRPQGADGARLRRRARGAGGGRWRERRGAAADALHGRFP